MSPTMHAPRKKSCQAILADEETACSRMFRGWGRYCSEHLEECAKLSGQYKDAAARTERLRRHGELSERQVRGLATVSAAERAVEKAQQYKAALEDEIRARMAHLKRFPAEKEARHEQRLLVLEERRDACAALISQLQQHQEDMGQSRRQRELERQPLLDSSRRRSGRVRWVLYIALFVLLVVVPMLSFWLSTRHILQWRWF
ncbi:hypothetical protein C8Q80DRAFT_1137225 [Daedaleopsis nitida]|nr:hypothetical protein C8Q80DRAFT_1137225 [Daedaleopsis nitida]